MTNTENQNLEQISAHTNNARAIIINVDDLGLSEAVNHAVIRLAERGLIGASSYMVGGNISTDGEIKAEMKAQSEGALKGVLGYTEDKVVATDFRGETCTSVFDADASIALDGTFVKIVAWYDNEWGYSNKCLEMVRVVSI